MLTIDGAGRPGSGAYGDRVPGVDRDDQADQRGDLLRREPGGDRVVVLGRDVVGGQQGDGLRERQGGALFFCEERRFAPCGQGVYPLLGLADGPRVLGVHVDAVGAAVDLGRADPNELAQLRVELDLVELLGSGVVEV
jgi:hypothetical protein